MASWNTSQLYSLILKFFSVPRSSHISLEDINELIIPDYKLVFEFEVLMVKFCDSFFNIPRRYLIYFLIGGNYDKSKSNRRHALIVPWSQYLTIDNNITNQAISSQEVSPKHQLSLVPLKGIKEKDLVKGNVIQPDRYFHQHNTYRSSHNAMFPNSLDNRNTRVINRFRQKNHTATAIIHQLNPVNPNYEHIQIPLVCVI